MNWHDLLFAHWPVDPAVLRPHVPKAFEIDTRDAVAWVGVIPFHMTGVRLRGLPAVPSIGSFVELNVRTYVTDGTHRGVWFCTLDAGSWLGVRIARWWWGLNYLDANIRCDHDGDWIAYTSERRPWNASETPASFTARYRPMGDPFTAKPDSLEHFFTERYHLYTLRRGQLIRGSIAHEPWQLRHAELRIDRNTVGDAIGIELQGEPHVLCSQCPGVRFWGREWIANE